MANSKIPNLNLSDTLNTQRLRFNQLIDSVGDVSTLTTTGANITAAINEVDGRLDSINSTELLSPRVTLSDSSATSIVKGNLQVDTNLHVNGNTTMGGTLIVDGEVTFKAGTNSNINLGDANTDNVVFNADVNSNIIPNTDDTYDLGNITQEWRHLYLDGTAYVDNLAADSATITGNLDVQGITTLDSATVDGALIVTDSAEFRSNVVVDGNVNIGGTITSTGTAFTLAAETGSNDPFTLGDTLTIAAGEGITTTVSNNQIEVAGEVATSSNKGVSSFSTDNFLVTSGNVTIKNDGVILGTETTGNYIDSAIGTANEIEVTHTAAEGSTVQIGLPSDVTISNDLTVNGGFTVGGTFTTTGVSRNASTHIIVNDGIAVNNSNRAGLAVDRPSTDSALMQWNELNDYWEAGTINDLKRVALHNDSIAVTSINVDNIRIDGNTISSTAGGLNINPLAGNQIVLDGTINIDAGVVTGATSITSTDLTGTIQTAAQTNITSLGTLTGLEVDGDVKFHGSTASYDVVWDKSANDLTFPDNSKIRMGIGDDMSLYVAGDDDTYLLTGNNTFYLRSADMRLQSNGAEDYVRGQANGAVTLYYDAVNRLATTSTGADINGSLTADSATFTNIAGALTGNASTATSAGKWTTARDLTFSGDATGTLSSVDGSATKDAALTLATVNSNVGSFGSATAIPTITVNGKGLITAVSTNSITTTLTVGADSGTNDAVSLAGDVLDFVGTTNEIKTGVSNNQLQLSLPDDVTIGNNLTVAGDLEVQGTTVTLNTANVDVEDATLRVAKNTTTLSATDGAGIEFGGSTSKPTLTWDNGNTRLASNKDFSATRFYGPITGDVTGDVTGTIQTAAQTNITSLGTLTTLTVDDITINSSKISDAGIMEIETGSDFIVDAGSGIIEFQEAGSDRAQIDFSSSNILNFKVGTSGSFSQVLKLSKLSGGLGGANVTGGLRVGDGLSPTDEDIYAVADIEAGGDVTGDRLIVKDGTGGSAIFDVDTNSHLTMDLPGDLYLDVDGGGIFFYGAGTSRAGFNVDTENWKFLIGTPASNTVEMSLGTLGLAGENGLYVGSAQGAPADNEVRAEGDITAFYSSDITLKENIVEINNALDKINSMRGVYFDWTDEHIESRGGEDGYFVRKHDIGVIAQEVEEVLPEVVRDRKDGTKAVDYQKMVALLIEGMKEQQQQIDNLQQEVKNLQER